MDENAPTTSYEQLPASSSSGDNPIHQDQGSQDQSSQDQGSQNQGSQNQSSQNQSSQNQSNEPGRPKGPNAAPVVLGLVAIAVAALIIASETMALRVDWSRLGPGAIVGVGVLLAVLGAIGLVRRRDER